MTEPADEISNADHDEPGSLMLRFVALILDFLILWVPLVIIWGAASRIVPLSIAPYVNTAIVFGYVLFMESTRGQTFGKQLMRLRVRNQQGSYPTPEQAFKRNLYLILAVLPGFIGGLVGLAAVICIAVSISLDPVHRQGVHDRFAGSTFVTRYTRT